MRKRRIFWLLSLMLVPLVVGSYPGWVQSLDKEQPKPGMKGPVITHVFAVDQGYYGTVWKVYLEAEDPDGEMLKIGSVVHEAGYGYYPTDWTYLKPEFQKHFKGYLQWNTFSSKAPYMPEWTQIALNVSVVDKSGNESNQVVFPFTFEVTPEQYSDKAPATFDQGSVPLLGHITIDLYSPGQGYGQGDKKD